MRLLLRGLAVLVLSLPSLAPAQSAPAPAANAAPSHATPPGAAPAAAGAGAQAQGDDGHDAFLASLHWVHGPASADIAGNSTFAVPKGMLFLNTEDTKKLLEAMHNPASGREYLFAPENLGWIGLYEFADSGYVKDDEKIDADALLQSFKDGTAAENKLRQEKGWTTIEITGWKVAPRYDSATRRLEWAIDGRASDGTAIVNYNTRILGRHGVTSALLVTDPQNLDKDLADFKAALGGYAFKQSERYDDFISGDKVAEYGLGALVLGGAAAVAAKKGLFAVIGGFLAAFWKLIVAGVVAAGAWLRSFFKRKKDA